MSAEWGRRLFQIGAGTLVLLGLAHSLSLFEPLTPTNATERQLLNLMTNYKFNLLGSHRTMNDLLRGFSVSFMIGALGLGLLDLLLSRERDAILKRLAMVNALWLAANTAVSIFYFFAIPTAFLSVAFVLFALAWLNIPAQTPTTPGTGSR